MGRADWPRWRREKEGEEGGPVGGEQAGGRKNRLGHVGRKGERGGERVFFFFLIFF